MLKPRRAAAIRTLRPQLSWSDADIAAWLDVPPSITEELAQPPASQPTHDHDTATSQQSSSTILIPASELLSRTEKPTHDPLAGWLLDPDILQALLLQCPIFGAGTTAEDVRITGDSNLANAILARLPGDHLVPVTICNARLIDRLDILLRSPTAADAIEHELSRHAHLLPAGILRDSDVAGYLGITEAAIRKARSRARKGGQK